MKPLARHCDSIDAQLRAAHSSQNWDRVVQLCRQALRKNARHLLSNRYLGYALKMQRQIEPAIKAFQQAAIHCPGDAELLINYSNLLLEQALNTKALPLLDQLCALRPTDSTSWSKVAQCCYPIGLHEKGFGSAIVAYNLARTTTEKAAALTQRAIHRRELGQIREAVEDCVAAIALTPEDSANHTNRLLFMLGDPHTSATELAAAAREYAAVFEQPYKSNWPDFAAHRGDPWRRLRIGFLSPDFRVHSVMYFVEGLLSQLDRRQFEIFAFYLYPRDDHVTERVQRHADHFVRLSGLNSQQQADAIRSQGIDILVDLAGHTGHNGLLAMALKAAPIQVSWLGFPATTGLEAMDYKFTDEVTDPPNVEHQYTEKLYRLPVFFTCYRPMSRNPLWRYQPRYLVRPTPALENGYITFGSCNNLGKLTDEVLTLWGRILSTIPGSRLLVEGKNLDRPDFAKAYRERCERLGLNPSQLDLVALNGDNQYLTYHRIDIALDPFPLTGGTTTYDALWMGLPVVSMVGDSFKSRMGVGMLTYLGRTEWLAQTSEEYVRIAQSLASDVQALNALRLSGRTALEQSPLMREDLYNHYFGEGLRAMWIQWLSQATAPCDAQTQQQLIADWLPDMPAEWAQPVTPGVGIAPGQRVSLDEAHQRLQALIDRAKVHAPESDTASGMILSPHWIAVTEMAEHILNAVPHDPVALASLAEVEFAHGHHEFAVTYLRYASDSMGRQA